MDDEQVAARKAAFQKMRDQWGSDADLASKKMLADAPLARLFGYGQMSPEDQAKLQDPATAQRVDDSQMMMGAGMNMGAISKVGQTAAEALQAARTGESTLEKYLRKMSGLQREGGAAQRLGVEANPDKAAQMANQIAQGRGGNMTDLSFLQQIKNKR